MTEDSVSLRDLVEQRLNAMDDALTLQLTETLRRLAELNHAHERSLEDRKEFVNAELFRETTQRIEALIQVNTSSQLTAKEQARSEMGTLRSELVNITNKLTGELTVLATQIATTKQSNDKTQRLLLAIAGLVVAGVGIVIGTS